MIFRLNRDLPEPPPDPIEQALQGVVDSARVANSRHLTFLVVSVFVFITVMGTDHGQLFLGDGDITLPLLGVKVSLLSFYSLAPWLIFSLAFKSSDAMSIGDRKNSVFTNPYHLFL